MGKLLIPLLILAFWVMSKLINSAQKRANAEKARRLKETDPRDEDEQAFEAESNDVQAFLDQMGIRTRRPQPQRQPAQQPQREPAPQPTPVEPLVQQFVSQEVDQQATHGVDQHAATGLLPERGQAAAALRRRRAKSAAPEPIELTPVGKPSDPFARSALRRLTPPQQAIVTMELLGPPRALREHQMR